MSNRFGLKGLTQQQVQSSRETHGENVLPTAKVETFWEKLIDNFDDPLIKILMVALIITVLLAFLGYAEWFEGVGIASAVFIASVVATYSEFKNESSFQKLQNEANKIKNTVIRDGQIDEVFVSEVVYGDYVYLKSGDRIPADGYIIMGDLSVNQMAVNGEPDPVRKLILDDESKESYHLIDNYYACFRGCIIVEGEGIMLTRKVGASTVYGQMIDDINKSEARKSPLELKLSNLADNISYIGYIGATLIALSFLFKQFVMDQNYSLTNTLEYMTHWQVALKDSVNALILAIIIIVVAVPEGLPMMIAIVLSLNMKKLLNSNVLVRKLTGIETAGSLSILFTDKTGTLTKGHLEPFLFVGGDISNFKNYHDIPKNLKEVVGFTFKHSTTAFINPDGDIVGGNQSERAFLSFIDLDYLKADDNVKRVSEILFSSNTKFTASMVEINSNDVAPLLQTRNNRITLIKGAPEKIIEKCVSFYGTNGKINTLLKKETLYEEIERLSSTGTRVVAYATSATEIRGNENYLNDDLIFLGFICLRDEIRDESPIAINQTIRAGIQVVMVTGDRKETAVSVARQIGLLPHSEEDDHAGEYSVLTSEELNKMDKEKLKSIIPELRVVSRALPSDKHYLVEVCQSMNYVVGMTGDGVNDAAALYLADVGFAMGSGTEMAKEAADLVILDDNFNSITKAILYGRTIFKTIRKFITFQSTINLASTLIVFIGPFLGFDFPLTLIQLLWVNLVMDTLAALAFGGEPALDVYMKENPIKRDDEIVSPYMWSSIISNGVFVAFMSIEFLLYGRDYFLKDGVLYDGVFLTSFFAFYIFITTINAFNVRTPKMNLLDNITENSLFLVVIVVIFLVQIIFTYIGGNILRTVPITSYEWKLVFLLSLSIIPYDIVRKFVLYNFLPSLYKGV